MNFDFSYYFNGGLLEPIILVILLLIFFIGSVIHIFKEKNTGKLKKDSLLKLFLSTLIVLFLINVNVGRLYNGGFWLIFEDESDVVITQGEISSIEEISRMRFPNINGYAMEIIINDEKYISMHLDGFKTGDYVTIKYLPKSMYVLSIHQSQ